MSIDSERQLRTQLGEALDELSPGPLPLDAVIRQGRTAVIRRRVLAVAAVIIVAAAAIALPKLVHNLAEPPPTSPAYHVTVHRPAKGSNKHLVAHGTLNKLRWSASVTYRHGETDLCWTWHHPYADWCDGTGGLPAFPSTPTVAYGAEGFGPDSFIMPVRADVSYLLVSLTNGQVVTLRPVAVLGRANPRYVAILVPSATSVTEISAYSARGEIGYSVPFSRRSLPGGAQFGQDLPQFEVVRWLRPGQVALPRRATYRIGHGIFEGPPFDGQAWSEYAYVGPWGTCFSSPTSDVSCNQAFVSRLTGGKVASVPYVSYWNSKVGWAVVAAKPGVAYIAARESSGAQVRVKTYSVEGARIATIFLPKNGKITGWIAYSAAGTRLASGGFN
jgi:hypothetical protein